MATPMNESEMQNELKELRADILKMITEAGSGHPGGSLSAVDIIMALYSGEMEYRANEPKWDDRDRFVLSKGHGVPALYAVMANKGFFPRGDLLSLRKMGSKLQGHPANAILDGIEASTGSLGQGLSVAHGMAIAAKLNAKSGRREFRVYCMLGDGEIQEGQVWEAAMSAPHLKLDNLTAIIDWNKAQIDGLVEDVMALGDLEAKWQSFGWHTIRIDGHDIPAIRDALKGARENTSAPTVIIADTIKGKGVSFMESNLVGWHGRAPTHEEMIQAVEEVSA